MQKTWFGLPLIALLAACGGEKIETYQVPKETVAAPAMPAPVKQTPAATVRRSSPGFSADLPDGWKEVPSSSAMRKASYVVEGTAIDAYFISLSMGDVLSNVNRWRGQVGLPNASLDAIEANMVEFSINGHGCKYFEIYNEENDKGIIAGIIDLSPSYWYFTAKGPVSELKVHTADMQNFLKSMKFDGHNH
ncbi:hypothetical protein P9H32_07010 [Pontiella sp. NLcol2]|uniref:Lipoprotein n=2 Tax=Pontiella agarivorans TaxID=3038953 RepID=A0ABU5MW76_9BACT|nr:hypothetical protein [Pontiella agarivorans]